MIVYIDICCIFRLNSSRIHTRTILIREETEHEELIGVKRVWLHPLRNTTSYGKSAYYDIAIMELGKTLFHQYKILKTLKND